MRMRNVLLVALGFFLLTEWVSSKKLRCFEVLEPFLAPYKAGWASFAD
jgi:hypothetical protein